MNNLTAKIVLIVETELPELVKLCNDKRRKEVKLSAQDFDFENEEKELYLLGGAVAYALMKGKTVSISNFVTTKEHE